MEKESRRFIENLSYSGQLHLLRSTPWTRVREAAAASQGTNSMTRYILRFPSVESSALREQDLPVVWHGQ